MPSPIKPFRVLCLDGGGMRGLYTGVLLQRLVQLFDLRYQEKTQDGRCPVPDIGKAFNMICGTSTGSILACALALGVGIDQIVKLYKEKGSLIFPHPMPKNFFCWALRHAKAPAADAVKLKETLSEVFKNITIKELYDKRGIALCIPSVNASDHKAYVFKTPHFPEKHRDNNYSLVDVCMASSSAPIFFPTARLLQPEINAEHFFVDGGLWANNPVLVGLIEALALTPKEQPVEVISIGTCEMPTGDPVLLKPQMGIADWKVGIGIIEMSISSQAYGYSCMAEFLSKILCSLGKDVKVIRLEESHKSNAQLSAIGLDKADKIAIGTLENLALSDANLNHSKVINNPEEEKSKKIKDIFLNILELN